jgi:serine protease Do
MLQAALARVTLSGALAATLVLGTGAGAQAQSLTPERLFQLSRPATVLVYNDIKGTIAIPEARLRQDRTPLLRSRAIERVREQGSTLTRSALIVAVINELIARPLVYTEPTDVVRRVNAETGLSGSGFIVTPDGYIVTNAHVARPPAAMYIDGLINAGMSDIFRKDAQDGVNEMAKLLGAEPSDELVNRFVSATKAFDLHYAQAENVTMQVYIISGVGVPGLSTTSKGVPAEVTNGVGEIVPGKDVAILKVEAVNLPTVPIGDDTSLTAGDPVYAIGFPGPATWHPYLAREGETIPTLTSGLMSARKPMSTGWSVIQTNADIFHGNSGGPAFDRQGKVVGITTFGTISNAGETVQGYNFIVPITIVNEFLSRVGVHQTTTSPFNAMWANATSEFDKEHYKGALATLQQINTLEPGLPYVQELMQRAQAKITAGQDKTPPPMMVWLIPLLILLAVGGAAVWWFTLRKTRMATVTGIRRAG